jgi:protein phosphatase
MHDMFRPRAAAEHRPEVTSSGHTNATEQRRLASPVDHLCAITDVGRVRDHNEDTFYISEDARVLIVADGMGGHEAGEVASALAVQVVADFFTPERQQAIAAGTEPLGPLLMQALEAAHRQVRDASQTREECHNMGTTLILAYIQGDHLYTCHVGDVRCYVQASAGLEQITQDHSVVGTLVQAGKLTPEEARVHPKKNELLQAIGLPHGIVPEVNTRVLANGDRALLCSDGLWESLSDGDVVTILAWDGSTRQRAIQLVDRANAAGGTDNITVVLYEHQVEGGQNDALA